MNTTPIKGKNITEKPNRRKTNDDVLRNNHCVLRLFSIFIKYFPAGIVPRIPADAQCRDDGDESRITQY